MTNKLFIVKYVFVDVDIKAIRKNSSIKSNKREDFNDIIDFDIIFAQNIRFFNVANNVANNIANKIYLIKVNKTIKKLIIK